MIQIVPDIAPGSYWICKSFFKQGIGPGDIFAKILSVKEDKIYIIRKTEYGFKDLPPMSFSVDNFLELYMRLED